MRQVKIHGGYVFRRGFKCRREDTETLFFDHVLSWGKQKPFELSEADIKRLISFLKRWTSRRTPLHESGVRIRASAHAIVRETESLHV